MPTTTPIIIDLHDLIEQKSPVRFAKVATTAGGEWAGNCPWCGGVDRFRCWSYSTRPHYWCRSCNKSGDAIAFLMEYCNMTFANSCQELGITPENTIQHETPMFFDDDPPPAKWQEMARSLIERAQKFLWNDKARHALDYLRGRGLTDETIVNANLGYIPLIDGKWFQSSFSDWGLTEDMLSEKQKTKGCIRVPNGILIPWKSENQIWKLAIKRFEAKNDEMPYGQIAGSKLSLYNSDSLARGKPVVLCEGEFDCLSVAQTCPDLIAPIATGSTSKGRTPLWIARLASQASTVLLSFDNDENGAGDKASDEWLEILPNALRWPPLAHDCNDMLQEGKSIKKWVVRGLGLATMAPIVEEPVVVPQTPPEPFPVWLARIEQELDALPQEEELWCCQCDGDMDSYTPDMKPLCARCWDAWQEKQEEETPLPFDFGSDIETFARHVATIGADLFDCTVTIISQDYTLEQHIAQLYPQTKQKTWADFRHTR